MKSPIQIANERNEKNKDITKSQKKQIKQFIKQGLEVPQELLNPETYQYFLKERRNNAI